MASDDLLAYLFDDKPHALSGAVAGWTTDSRRFAAFVETYRDKIRKKLRGTRDGEGVRDVQAELETAYVLLQERRFTVEYEKYGVGKARCPDFTVTFRANVLFNVEVTRKRASERAPTMTARTPHADLERAPSERERESNRFLDLVCAKLTQMQPGMVNLLWVVVDSREVEQIDVTGAMRQLKARAESRDVSLFTRHGFIDTADFFRHYLRLSGIVVRAIASADANPSHALWVNNQAQHPIPAAIRTILEKHS